jgi:hypothetical protein
VSVNPFPLIVSVECFIFGRLWVQIPAWMALILPEVYRGFVTTTGIIKGKGKVVPVLN